MGPERLLPLLPLPKPGQTFFSSLTGNAFSPSSGTLPLTREPGHPVTTFSVQPVLAAWLIHAHLLALT